MFFMQKKKVHYLNVVTTNVATNDFDIQLRSDDPSMAGDRCARSLPEGRADDEADPFVQTEIMAPFSS